MFLYLTREELPPHISVQPDELVEMIRTFQPANCNELEEWGQAVREEARLALLHDM